jgi:hypothetical protein
MRRAKAPEAVRCQTPATGVPATGVPATGVPAPPTLETAHICAATTSIVAHLEQHLDQRWR